MRFFKKAKRGFTLVELVVVIAVIAILAAVSVGAYFGVTESANNSRLEQETKQIQTAIKTVALKGDANHTLNADGLRVDNVGDFEVALVESTGSDFNVLKEEHDVISVPTIVLHEAAFTKEQNTTAIYKTFEYFNPEISNKRVVASTVTSDFKIINENFTVDTDAGKVTYHDIYFDAPGNTTGVKAYFWNERTTNGDGEEMTVVSQVIDLYKISVPSYYTHFTFESNTGKWDKFELNFNAETPCFTASNGSNGSWTELPDIPADYPVTGLTIYYSNSNYDPCNIWAWSVDGTNISENWAGIDITSSKDELNLYSYTFERDWLAIKFSSGNAETNEISLAGATEETPYWNGDAWAAKPTEKVPEFSKYDIVGTMNGESFDKSHYLTKVPNEENKYQVTFDKLTVGVEFKVRFEGSWAADKCWGYPEVEQTEIYVGSGTNGNVKVLVEGKYTFVFDASAKKITFTYEGEGSPIHYDQVKVYFVNLDGWTNVSIHHFGSVMTADSEWPGVKMEDEGNDIYSYTVYKDTKIVFTNGDANSGVKTNDLSLEEGKWYFERDKWVETPHSHDFTSGECSCGNKCPHDYSNNDGICKTCSFNHENAEGGHTWDNGTCSICHLECDHNLVDGKCTICKIGCDHNWENKDGVCAICGVKCVHTVAPGSTCEKCGYYENFVLYLQPNEWKNDGAWFVVKLSGSSTLSDASYKMVDSNLDGVYEITADPSYTKATFYRMNTDKFWSGTLVTGDAWNISATQTIDKTKPCFVGSFSSFSKKAFTPTTKVNTLGLCGAYNNWGSGSNDRQFVLQEDGHTYILSNTNLATTDLKLRVNNAWDVDYGYNRLDSASRNLATNNGGNFRVKTAGNYDIVFDTHTGLITLTKLA